MRMNGRLYRSRRDRVIAGVAGGLAEYLDLDPTIVRVLWAVLTLVSGGVLIVVYILMAIIVPEEPRFGERSYGMAGSSSAPGSPAPGASSASDESAAEASTGTVDESGRPTSASESGWARPASSAWGDDRPGEGRRERRGSSGLVIGLILIVLGAVFLLREYVPALDWDRLWPVALIAVGVVLLAASVRRRDRRDWGTHR